MANMDGLKAVPKRLVASYVLDWIVIVGITAVGAGLNFVTPNMKPFSLTDPSIGFPYVGDTIPTWLLVVVTLAAPAAIILVTILVLLPGPTIGSNVSRNKIWTVKLWELHTGLAGLCLACALALLVTDGMKQLLGKPRPNVLSRCMPDTANAEQYAVKDLDGNVVSGELLVTAAICLQTDKSMLDEAFRAFNSGHSSFSAASLTYLTLFICAKFAIAIPFATPRSSESTREGTRPHNESFSSRTSSAPILASDMTFVSGGFRTVLLRLQTISSS